MQRFRYRRLLRFKLRTFLLIVPAITFWLARETKQAHHQRRAVEAIQKWGGSVGYDYQHDKDFNDIPNAKKPGPAWLRNLIGDDYFMSVTVVSFGRLKFNSGFAQELDTLRGDLKRLPDLRVVNCMWCDDEVLKVVDGLDQLEFLTFRSRSAQLSHSLGNESLIHLRNLTNLRHLYIQSRTLTGLSLSYISKLPHLEVLVLNSMQISDDDLVHLKNLNTLKRLHLDSCRIVGPGLAHLSKLPRLEELGLRSTEVTDSGLRHVSKLSNLRVLALRCGQLTDAGLAAVAPLKKLETLNVSIGFGTTGNRVLQSLPNLSELNGQSVTQTLPKGQSPVQVSQP